MGFWNLSQLASPLNFPLLYLAFLYGPSCNFTSEIETVWVKLLALAYALHVFRPGLLAAQILVRLSPMVRDELALPANS